MNGEYTAFKHARLNHFFDGVASLGQVKVLLTAPEYAPDFQSHKAYEDIIEVEGPGYPQGGYKLPGMKLTEDRFGKQHFVADNITIKDAQFDFRHIVLYMPKPNILMVALDPGKTTKVDGNAVIRWPMEGLWVH